MSLRPRAREWLRAAVFGDPAQTVTADQMPAGQAQIEATRGVAAAVVVFVVLGVLHLLGTPPFAPPDETAHVAYALALMDGEIPHISAFPEQLPVPGMREGLSVWTANHPPGAYAVLGVPLWLGDVLGRPLLGFWAARMLNVLGGAVALVLGARIVALLLPHRPRAVVGTTMLAAMVPYFIHIAGTAYTDGLALAPTVALLATGVEVLVRGPSRVRLAMLILLSGTVALMRAPAVVLVLLTGIAWGVAQLQHRDDALRHRLGRAVGGAALMGLSALVAAGWFYVGNIEIYGDPTGSQALFDLHSRSPRGSFWPLFTASQQYRFQELQLWSKIEGLEAGMDYVISGYFVRDIHKVTLVVLWTTGLVTAVAVGRTRLRGLAPTVAGWVLLATWWWALMTMMVLFVTDGGAPHARYLWPGFTGLALVLVIGLDAWRLPLHRLPLHRLPLHRLNRLGMHRWGHRITRVPLPSSPMPVGLYGLLGCLVWANVTGLPRALELFGLTDGGSDLPTAVAQMFNLRGLAAPGWWAMAAIAVLVGALAVLARSLWATPVHLRSHMPATTMDQAPAAVAEPVVVGSIGGG